MTEIDKLFENAGIEKDWKPLPYGDIEEYYPEFTAEKQLEIVKFMFHKGIYYDTDGDTYWFHYTGGIENARYRPFEEAIAEFINDFWQSLTDQEKTSIKNILEM